MTKHITIKYITPKYIKSSVLIDFGYILVKPVTFNDIGYRRYDSDAFQGDTL